MFPIPFNFPFINKNGSRTTIGDAINAGGGGGSYTLPTASAETKGGVKIGSGLTMTGEVLSNTNPTPYSLPAASAETLGGVKVGSGLSINNGVLSATGGGGGSKIYYKTFNGVSYSTYYGNVASNSFRLGITASIDVSGYTPIGVKNVETDSNYVMSVGLKEKNSVNYIMATINGDHNSGSFIVYYVKNTDAEDIT